ncbi:MAG TPA: hypothetical protein VFW66_08420 [Gemmatimonadales bacterium]|nr:hypothetical protein [Gemmatimonadales bacterium]
MTDELRPLDRQTFCAQHLMTTTPPIWHDRNKLEVFAIACPPGSVHGGQLEYTRWPDVALPAQGAWVGIKDTVEHREGVYDYVPLAEGRNACEWHVNFADPNLFVAYGSPLLAQDELQVLEHPALGALKEALGAARTPMLTTERGRPTPILVLGAERRCKVATDRSVDEGRPDGLYGQAFARATLETVRRATRRVEPPTVTNLIAMTAPSGGYGRYSASEVENILATAWSAFRAACVETARHAGTDCSVIVHTGFWGCGAFGGNRELMAMVQVIAARMAGVRQLVFHTFDRGGTAAFSKALCNIEQEFPTAEALPTRRLIEGIAGLGLVWGESDGN